MPDMDDDDDNIEVMEYCKDTDNSARFLGLSIPQIMDIISLLNPIESEDDDQIINEWLVPEFNLYDSYLYYEPDNWQVIAIFARGLLVKRAFQEFQAGKIRL